QQRSNLRRKTRGRIREEESQQPADNDENRKTQRCNESRAVFTRDRGLVSLNVSESGMSSSACATGVWIKGIIHSPIIVHSLGLQFHQVGNFVNFLRVVGR